MITIGILECGRNLERWLAEHGDFADWFPPWLQSGLDLAPAGDAYDYRIYRTIMGDLPHDPRECDVWLLTGSPSSVYENGPWQQALTSFVLSAEPVRPIVGICYGHQHLHAALGGTVALSSSWGVGIHTYDVQAEPAWLTPALAAKSRNGLRMIALHRDQVVTPAPGTVVLAGNSLCPFGITTIGPNILTVQTHPEMRPAQAEEIYRYHLHDIGPEQAEAAIASLNGPLDRALTARWVVDFIRHHATRENEKGDPA